ncbi:hypothetical protein C7H19_01900 [Aphanothece hegewaldii CCALA 016]|uniref:Outer membrane protein beta-barrel domain-containing protein n=1 Tax=Aphanothece hegewaldii CCALA 016 TaxID=2107694 RepID=A0A2T1M402_9CHRO|nr:hypothetical protein [Aphanothece hegewaldii]PSF39567.1 hypothetical protein C7H19_01900 [Aphanothece hegewaldii CCALA 016]
MKLNRILFWGALALTVLAVNPSLAVDHNNLDAGRPLSFDDAESIAYREQSIEFGAGLNLPSNRSVGGSFEIEYLYGFALNSHLVIGLDPSVGGKADTDDTRLDVGNLSVGVFHNFNREYNNVPAFAIRGDVGLPTGRDARGVDIRLRGIASKTVGQYDRLHLNLDLNVKTDVDSEERSVIPGLILGYSRPLGYPKRFDKTFLAEMGVRASQDSAGGAILITGVGIRQQVSLRSVLDFGIEGDIATGAGERSELRLKVGYSFGF